jgi:hypothetical protein
MGGFRSIFFFGGGGGGGQIELEPFQILQLRYTNYLYIHAYVCFFAERASYRNDALAHRAPRLFRRPHTPPVVNAVWLKING